MREIKFRGYNEPTKEFVYGYYSKDDEGHHWINKDDEIHYFIRNIQSIGQYTGLKDKNDKEIYEGDILKWDEKEWGGPFNELVEWDFDQLSSRVNDWRNYCEIIGNIYKNPELLK